MVKVYGLYRDTDWGRQNTPQKPKQESFRSEARRDLGRLIHSASFRRLQGKTQLFPNADSDFFRNRLTHSLEVAQIAKAIAIRLNNKNPNFKNDPIDLDLVEFAGLSHDIGHPPFGHIGEEALDDCMLDFGGFEGNAQTLRILTRLEKRDVGGEQSFEAGLVQPVVDGQDMRLGLNITFRSMAAILKYDQQIKSKRQSSGPTKGYYYFDNDLVRKIKSSVVGTTEVNNFKTIECSIMDLADDIAYSTYDVEDAFKANVLSPIKLVKLTTDLGLFELVAAKVSERLTKFGYRSPGTTKFSAQDAINVVDLAFSDLFKLSEEQQVDTDDEVAPSDFAKYYAQTSDMIAEDGYYRTNYTSGIVQESLNSIDVQYNADNPALSSVRLTEEAFCRVEVIKNLTYEVVIRSPSLKLIEFRGKKIIRDMFAALSSELGEQLLPDDHRHVLKSVLDPAQKKRVVCDFIAGMTDRYALEFYQRLFETSPATIYKPF